MKYFKTISSKINIVIIFIFILILSLLTLINNFIIRDLIINIISSKQQESTSFLTSEIETKISLLHLALIKRSYAITKEIISDPEKAQEHLDTRMFLLEIFDNGIFLFTPDGKIIAESPFKGYERRGLDLSYREYIQKTLETKKPYISDPYITTQKHKSPVIMFTAPVFDENNNMIAILTGSLNLLGKNTLEIIRNKKIGKSGFMYLINSEGTYVAHPDLNKIFTTVKKGVDETIDSILDIKNNKYPLVINNGKYIYIANRFSIKPNWILVFNYPIEELLEPITKVKFYILLLSIGFSLVIVLLVPEITKVLLSGLSNFTNHIKNITNKSGSDRYYTKKNNDEIDILADAFNEMIDTLDKRFNELKDKQEKFELFATFATDMVYYLKPDGTVFYISPSCLNLTGYTQDEFFQNSQLLNDIIYPDDKSIWDNATHGEEMYIELRILTKNGDIKWISHVCRKIYDEKNNFVGIRGSNRDITHRKTLENALKDQAKLLNELIDIMPTIICLKDPEGRWLLANKADLELFGLSNVDYKGKTDLDLADYTLPIYKDAFTNCVHSDNLAWENKTLTKSYEIIPIPNKPPRHFNVLKLPIFNQDGTRKALLVVGQDITEVLEMQNKLNEAKKLEAIGQLASGVAHNFNNILMILNGYIEILDLKLPDDNPLKSHLTRIKSTIDRGARVVDELLYFSKDYILNLEKIELNQYINSLLSELNTLLKPNIKFSVNFTKSSLMINADKDKIKKILVNIISNAVDAIGNSSNGIIRINSTLITIYNYNPSQYQEILPGKYAIIQIYDNGKGIDTNNKDQIFNPFYTTKDIGKGLGLGLSIAYGIVRQHNGFIKVFSKLNKGTVFKIFIPISE